MSQSPSPPHITVTSDMEMATHHNLSTTITCTMYVSLLHITISTVTMDIEMATHHNLCHCCISL